MVKALDNFVEQLLRDLESKLQAIEVSDQNVFTRLETAVALCDKALEQLKKFYLKYKFRTTAEEIEFFKLQKPRVEARLKYYVFLFNIEKRKPTSTEAQKQYFEQELEKIDQFVQSSLEFYTYYRTGCTHFDDKYFVRGINSVHMLLEEAYNGYDRNFNTSHDGKVSRILAYDRLSLHLRSELARISRVEAGMPAGVHSKKLIWTESKVAFVELVYALHYSGALNRGATDLSDLSAKLSKLFNIEPGDIYRQFIEIKQRKEPVKFLNDLRRSLLNKIEKNI